MNGLLFKCDWVDNQRKQGVENTKFNLTLVNLTHICNDEALVLASQAEQAFYVPDMEEKGWYVIGMTTPIRVL